MITPKGGEVMKSAQLSVIAFPKLSKEKEILELREKFVPEISQIEPHIPIVSPWTPAELGEVLSVIDSISRTRKKLSPIAIAGEGWRRQDELLILEITEGAEALVQLSRNITGAEPLSLLPETKEEKVNLIVCRIPKGKDWGTVLKEAKKIGRTVGVIDSMMLIRHLPDRSYQRVAKFPFGVGRVDFYERLLG
ncbi:MAG: hypothetical protein ABIK39_01655 [candidate division WOR-3 bacterium]